MATQGYDVELITFDNGCEEKIENVRNRATILKNLFINSKFGKVHNLGVFSSIPEFRDMRYQSLNIPFSVILKKYGDLNQNQLNCLSCRSGMYIVGVAVARELGIKHIADGARKTQMFALEQKELLDKYSLILSKYDIDLLTPVFDYESDWHVEKQLMRYSIHFFDNTNSYECKCWLGAPMNHILSDDVIKGCGKIFDDLLAPKMILDINEYPASVVREYLEKPTYSKIKFK